MKGSETAARYKAQSIHYLENALGAIQAGDAEKASEFLWGSMAEALKAVAASEGTKLYSHGDIGKYARKLAKEKGDQSIVGVYGSADLLHSNFYEAKKSLEEVNGYAEGIRATVAKLLALIPEEGQS